MIIFFVRADNSVFNFFNRVVKEKKIRFDTERPAISGNDACFFFRLKKFRCRNLNFERADKIVQFRFIHLAVATDENNGEFVITSVKQGFNCLRSFFPEKIGDIFD